MTWSHLEHAKHMLPIIRREMIAKNMFITLKLSCSGFEKLAAAMQRLNAAMPAMSDLIAPHAEELARAAIKGARASTRLRKEITNGK